MSSQPWYTFPRIDKFGTKDSQGNYWKPDSNIQIPGNYPVTNVTPGTVTSVQRTSWGQTVITIRMDSPRNALATHAFYEHMSKANVQVGQHIGSGTLLGYNNPQGTVPLGFGFYNGDVYGSGPAWNQLQADLCPGCPNQLNPVSFLNSLKSGGVPTNTTIPGGVVGGAVVGAVPPPPIAPQTFFAQTGQHIALFLIAIVLVGAGLFVAFSKQIGEVFEKSKKTAEKVAIAA